MIVAKNLSINEKEIKKCQKRECLQIGAYAQLAITGQED